MLFGAHVSAGGGIWNAPENAAKIGCEVFQYFSRPPQGGPAPKLTEDVIRRFREACDRHGFGTHVIHAPYILNLASLDTRIRQGSIRMIREELDRGTLLGAKAVMFHPGSAREVDLETGITMVADGIREILKGYKGTTQLLIEISAGSGNVIGDTFEEVTAILNQIQEESVGVCFDTAHAFASGYDLRTPDEVKNVISKFDRVIGLERLVMSHCNDSKVELGAKKDRHDHLGDGHIGLEGFRALLADKRLSHLFWIVETPVGGQANDIEKLKKIRENYG